MRYVTSRLIALAPGVRWRLAWLVVLAACVTATYVGQAILIARVLARIFEGSDIGAVVPELVVIVVLQAVRSLVLARREVEAFKAAGAVTEAVRDGLVAKLLDLGPGWLQRTRTGEVQSTVVDGVEHLDPFVGRFLPQTVAAVIGAVGITVYIVILDPLVGSIVLVCAVIAPVVPLLSRRLLDARSAVWMKSYRGLYSETLDAVQGMATLKAFNASRRRGVELHRDAEAVCHDSIRLLVMWACSAGAQTLVAAVGTAVSVGLGAIHYATGELSLTELFTILLLTREAFRSVQDLRNVYHLGYTALPASKGIFELLDAEPDVEQPVVPVPVSRIVSPPALSFDDVSFAYPDRPEPALERFSLEISPGERVALVGSSGAGKTTIVSLLLRFFELEHGRILIGGESVRDLSPAAMRSLVAVVAQDTFLFHGSVRRNLTLGREDASDSEVEAAARAARAHDFISALPHGYDTIVGERGLKLSGGERQRIAIARALLKDAPVLVLDEPTSSVDAANEAQIQVALDDLTRGRTTLVIAHRLSTVRNAERVVVLDAGRVLETGDHDALLARGGAYADLVAAQEGTS